MNYREKIRNAYDTLSPSFRTLAEFILDHTYEAAFLNASQLAKRLKLDPATVVRFAQRLAYPGYPELLEEIRDEVQSDLSRFASVTSYSTEAASVVMAAVRQEISNLEMMQRSLRPDDINRLAEAVQAANHIVVVAEGASAELAAYFARQLGTLELAVTYTVADAESLAMALRGIKHGDVVIGVTATPVAQDVAHALRLSQKRGAVTVSIAGAQSWPASIAADLVISGQNETAVQLPGPTAIAALLSGVFQALWIVRQERQVDLAENFEQLLAELTELRNAESTPRTPEMMTEAPAKG